MSSIPVPFWIAAIALIIEDIEEEIDQEEEIELPPNIKEYILAKLRLDNTCQNTSK